MAWTGNNLDNNQPNPIQFGPEKSDIRRSVNRSYEIRRDTDNFSDVSITLFDIDSTILLSSTQSQDTTIYAYPIPFNSNLDGHEHIEFSGLSDGQTISIYDLLGRYVYKNSDPNIPFKWDVLNNAGVKINSGIYIYIIKDEEENKVTSGKLIVIR